MPIFTLNWQMFLDFPELQDQCKTSRGCKTLPRVHLIGFQCVKLFLPKDCLKFYHNWIVRIGAFELSHFQFFWFYRNSNWSFVAILFFFIFFFCNSRCLNLSLECSHYMSCVLSPLKFLRYVTGIVDFFLEFKF